MNYAIMVAITFVISVLIGSCISFLVIGRGLNAGKMIIDMSDPNKDTIRLDLTCPAANLLTLKNGKRVWFTVSRDDRK